MTLADKILNVIFALFLSYIFIRLKKKNLDKFYVNDVRSKLRIEYPFSITFNRSVANDGKTL